MKLTSRTLQFYRDDRPTAKKIPHEDFKPHQPSDLRKSRWVLGDRTEVLDHNSWKLGKIAEVLKNDYFVIRLKGCIQLREFHLSSLRVPLAYHSKRLTVTHKDSELIKPSQLADFSNHRSKFVMGQDRLDYEEEDSHSSKRHKAANLCPSTSARIMKRELALHNTSIRRTNEKRKEVAYEVHQRTKKVLPLARNSINADCLYRPLSSRIYDQNNTTKTKSDCKVCPLSEIPFRAGEENECSVASCSANYSEYCSNGDQQSVGIGSCFPDDVMSTYPSISELKNDNVHGSDLDMNVHELELQAYQSTVRAFHALGSLTWEQESLLTNLRLSLNISNEEHLLELRHLLSS